MARSDEQVAGGAKSSPATGHEWADPVARIVSDWNAERPGLDPAPILVIGRVVRLEGLIAPQLRGALAIDGLDVGLYDVLAALRRAGAPYRSTPTELARLTMVTTGGITGRIDRLEHLALVERERAGGDRRVTYVRLTKEGLAVIDRAFEALLRVERRLLAGLPADQVERLARDLADLERSVVQSAD